MEEAAVWEGSEASSPGEHQQRRAQTDEEHQGHTAQLRNIKDTGCGQLKSIKDTGHSEEDAQGDRRKALFWPPALL